MAKKKKKAAPIVDLAEDEDAKPKRGRSVASEDDEAETTPRARSDVYVGLILITTLILIGASVFLYLDQEDLSSAANKGFNPPTITVGALAARPAK